VDVFALLLADARLPTGGHTQSAGLEAAMQAGLSVGDVPAYLRSRLATVVRVEAGTAVAARAACAAADPAASLRRVDTAWRARVVSPALRAATIQLGRGYARLIGRLWPDRPETVALLGLGTASRPVAMGVAAALAGLDAASTARLVVYDDVQTACAAALKLHPMDPADAVGWVVEVAGDIEDLVAELADIAAPEDIPATGAPLIEAWAEVHAVTQQRLFRA
jgi:urease accessory protein